MKRFILGLSAMTVLFGAMSSPLLAAGHSGGGHVGGGHVVAVRGPAYGLHYGPGGYLGREYCGWSGSYFNAAYRCQWYFCPQARCYYYWYAPGACYLPVAQIGIYPPTVGLGVAIRVP
jgi:hypothetical protein